MNTFVTETESLHHLHRAGYVVATEMVEAHHAEAIDLDPQARELAIFRTEASRRLPADELVRAVDAYADDLRKRDAAAVLAIVECVGADNLRAAVERGRAITSVKELDARAEALGFKVRASDRMTCPHCGDEILRKDAGHLLACAKDKAAPSR